MISPKRLMQARFASPVELRRVASRRQHSLVPWDQASPRRGGPTGACRIDNKLSMISPKRLMQARFASPVELRRVASRRLSRVLAWHDWSGLGGAH